MNLLQSVFLNPPKHEMVIEGIRIIPRMYRNFFIEYNGKRQLVKKTDISSFNRPFLVVDKIPNIEFHLSVSPFILNGEFFEVYDIDLALRNADFSCFESLVNLYKFSSNIKFIQKDFVDVQHLIWQTAHFYTPHYGTSLGDICQKLTNSLNHDLRGCQRGFFHGDMHFGNILQGDDSIHIIDFDSVKYSYAALNLAEAFAIDVISGFLDGKIDFQKVSDIRQVILSSLTEVDAYYFNFFVSLMVFTWHLRATPNAEIKDYKSALISNLEASLTFLQSFQSSEYHPILGSDCIQNGKIVLASS